MFSAVQSVRRVGASRSGVLARRSFHQPGAAAAPGLFGKLFGGKKDEPKPAAPEEGTKAEGAADQAKDTAEPTYEDYEELERKPVEFMFTSKEYKPEQLEQRVKEVLAATDVALATPDWKATSIGERDVKFKVLSAVIKDAKVPVTSRMLNNVQTVGDLLGELIQKPVSPDAGHPVAKFYKEKKGELPSNMKFEPFRKGTRKLHARQ
ncbi:hypothetical protein GGF46_001594 [Coemansia sp. RSA 552]|nr:hypothetical protein GGF46_001594 [Coemansia sp. RSA 552]